MMALRRLPALISWLPTCIREGLKEGREEGSKDERSKIAINLIRLGASCEIITQATGLSAEEVSKLKEEMSNA